MANNANGFLLPAWYVAEEPTDLDLNIVSIIWGFSLACSCFTFTKALEQSAKCFRRGKLRNAYIIMVWAEWLVCVVISIASWLYLSPSLSILPGFWIFFWLLVLWVVQIQCILQIIINRVRLLMTDQRKADQLKWAVAIFVGLINISVFVIWIPARLQISQRWVDINNVWDRFEKALFGLCDIGLNLYFIYLVRSKLIVNGLTKYQTLLRFNMVMIFISVSLDGVLIGMMSLRNSAVYVQFHPLVYLLKLHIEMNMSELIAKIVRATNHLNEYHNNDSSDTGVTNSKNVASCPSRQAQRDNWRSSSNNKMNTIDPGLRDYEIHNLELGANPSEAELKYVRSPDLERGSPRRQHDEIEY